MNPNILTRKLLTREGFLGLITVAVGGLIGLILGIPIIGYVLSPLINQAPESWQDVSSVDPVTGALKPNKLKLSDIQIGQTMEVSFQTNVSQAWAGTTSKQGAWLRRTGPDTFTAFAIYCTHLGCPIHWLSHPKIFLCPCHGSVFNSDGTVAGGPAPRPLFTWPVRVQNGRIQIKTHPLPVVT